MKVKHEGVEETAPVEVYPYENDEDYRRDVYTFDFDGEIYRATIADSDRRTAYVLKHTSGPDNDERLEQIKGYLVKEARIRSMRTIDPRKGFYTRWRRSLRLRRR